MKYTGIPSYPRIVKHRSLIEALSQKIGELPRQSLAEISKLHNLYTAYNVLLQMAGSGGRPVHDPFCFRSDLNLEHKYSLINDKATSTAHANRLSWMCEMQVQQFNSYFEYLQWLASKLLEEDKCEAAQRVLSVQSPRVKNSDQLVPVFFFIDRDAKITGVTGTSLEKILDDGWGFYLNSSRKILEKGMLDLGISHWLVDFHLNHILDGVPAFTDSSSLAYEDCREQIASALQIILSDWGFKPLHVPHSQVEDPVVNPKAGLIPLWTFGPIRRAAEAIEIRERLLVEVRQEFKRVAAAWEGEDSKLDDAQVIFEQISDRVVEQSGDDFSTARDVLSQLDEYVVSIQQEKKLKWIDRKFSLPVKEPLIQPGWSEKFISAIEVRDSFSKYLETRQEKSIARAWAEIVVSASLNGMYHPGWLRSLAGASAAHVQRHGDIIYVDIHDLSKCDGNSLVTGTLMRDGRPKWRWIPDPMSRCLIIGLFRRFTQKQIAASTEVKIVAQETFALLEQLGVQPRYKVGNVFKKICSISRPYWVIHHPGWLVSVFDGSQPVTPLSETAFLRTITGNYVPQHYTDKPSQSRRQEKRREAFLELQRAKARYQNKTRKRRKDSKGTDRENLDTRREKWNENIDDRSSYLKWKKGAFSRAKRGNKTLQANLAKSTRRMLAKNQNLPENYRLIAEWLYVMCMVGTRVRGKKAKSTLRGYTDIVEAVIDYFSDKPLSILDSTEIESIFVDAVKAIDYSNPRRAVGRLLDFHEFLEEFYGYDRLDWSRVYSEFKGKYEQEADAQFVTEPEYQATLKLIAAESEENDPYVLLAQAGLLLGYRFGLRMGEVIRLTFEDIQLSSENLVVIQVKNGRLGATKSYAGIRQVPILGTLPEHEYKLLERVLDRMTSSTGVDNSTPVFSLNDERYCRSLINDDVVSALRMVVGDERVRFHSLRHSWVSRHIFHFFDGALSSPTYDTLRKKLIGAASRNTVEVANLACQVKSQLAMGDHIDSRSLDEMAMLTGHASQASTLGSYFCFSEFVAEAYSNNRYGNYSLSDGAVARILSQDIDYVKNRRQRKRLTEGFAGELLSGVFEVTGLENRLPMSSAPFKSRKQVTRQSANPISLLDIDRVLTAYAIRTRSFDNLGVASGLAQRRAAQVVEISSAVEAISGYRLYGLEAPNHFVNGRNDPRFRSIYREQQKFGEFLKETEAGVEDLDDAGRQYLERALDAWERCYYGSGTRDSLLTGSTEDDELCAKLYLFFGISSADLLLRVHRSHNTPLAERMAYWSGRIKDSSASADRYKYSVEAFEASFGMQGSSSRLPAASHIDRKTQRPRPAISYAMGRNTGMKEKRDVVSQKFIHRASFLLLVKQATTLQRMS